MCLGKVFFAQISLGKTSFCSPLLEIKAVRSFLKNYSTSFSYFFKFMLSTEPLCLMLKYSVTFLTGNVCSEKHFAGKCEVESFLGQTSHIFVNGSLQKRKNVQAFY